MDKIHIIYRDGEVFECHGSRDKADARYELHECNDTDQEHTWSMMTHEILSQEGE